ncbi:MAG TPA: BamA/TamA family outer membrane protein [Polyangiaceae bacterium]|nr:BamA/TamA family outer membrane protein [Polyangiaceae bacterium]
MGILRILALLTRPSARVRRVTAYRLRPVLAFVLACGLLFVAHGARAEEQRARTEDDTEFTLVPVIGGDSDVGLGVGYVASFAVVRPGVSPYVWRLESAGALTARFNGADTRLGYFDQYVTFVVPRALGRPLRFEATVGYTIEPTLRYYGIGNASGVDPGRSPDDQYYQFERRHSIASANASYRVGKHFLLLWGLAESHNVLDYGAGSNLAHDLAAGDPATRDLLHVAPEFDVMKFSYGVGWDSRDSEVSSHHGQYHTLRFDASPGGTSGIPYAWGRADLALRGYVTLLPHRLIFAARGVLDWLVGTPPFYELSRYDETEAVGGGRGLRGVPAGRYYGTVKAFTNLELRSELFRFRLLQKQNVFGVTAFADTGRVWSKLPPSPELDGTGLGLKVGLGLGARVTAGESFVLRADVAWSPDANPIGAYLLAGQMF